MSDGFPTNLGLDLRGASLPGLPAAKGAAQPAADAGGRSSPAPATASPAAPALAVSAAQARCGNAALIRRRPFGLRVGNRQVQMVLLPGAGGAGDAPWLALSLDSAPAAVALPWSLIRRIAGQPLEAATPDDAALLVEDALTGWLDAAEDALGLSLRFAQVTRDLPQIADPVALSLGIEIAGSQPSRHRLRLMLSPAAADALARALAHWDRPRGALPGLSLRLRIEIDGTPITLAELESLAPGDALLLPGDVTERQPVAIVEGALAAPVAPVPGGGWRLAAPFAPRPPQGAAWPTHAPTQLPNTFIPRTDAMTDADQQPGTDPAPASATDAAPATQDPRQAQPAAPPRTDPAPGDQPREGDGQLAAIDALELRLSFRVGEALMPLAELRRAGVGTIVTLDRPDGAPVDIVVNGQVVGTGQIVTVAGQKACEIRTLFGDG